MKLLFKIGIIIMRIVVISLSVWAIYELFTNKNQWLEILLICLYFPSLICSMIIFINKRNSIAKLTWLFFVLAIPVLGPFLYIVFAGRYKKRMSQKKYLEKYRFANKEVREIKEKVHPLLTNISNYSKKPVVQGNIDSSRRIMDSFVNLFEDIKKAKKFIHMHYYIIKSSEIWDELRQLLLQKNKEGVEIRIIVDDFGTWKLPWYDFKQLRKNGIEVKLFNKVIFPFISSEALFRTHRKYTIIDGTVAYIGGANIADEYISFIPKYGAWEDVVSKIDGDIMTNINSLFIIDWYFVSQQKLSKEKYNPNIQINSLELNSKTTNMVLIEETPEIKESIFEDILSNLIYNTKKEIQLSSPYFVPSVALLNALKVAAMKGIKITIYIPGLADKKIVLFTSKIFANELLPYGVKVKQLNKKFLHSKIGLFDKEIAYIGTSNLDYRSLFSQFENNLFFEGKPVKQIDSIFKIYDSNSQNLKFESKESRNLWKRFKFCIAKIIAPVL